MAAEGVCSTVSGCLFFPDDGYIYCTWYSLKVLVNDLFRNMDIIRLYQTSLPFYSEDFTKAYIGY